MMRAGPLVLAAALLGGCGNYIILTVDCDKTVPDEVDTLDLRVLDPDTDAELGQFEIPLNEGETFPVELLVEPRPDSPSPLQVRILARRCGNGCATNAIDVASAAALVTWEAEAINEAAFPPLVDLP